MAEATEATEGVPMKLPAWPKFDKEPSKYHTHNLRQKLQKAERYLAIKPEGPSKAKVEELAAFKEELENRLAKTNS